MTGTDKTHASRWQGDSSLVEAAAKVRGQQIEIHQLNVFFVSAPRFTHF